MEQTDTAKVQTPTAPPFESKAKLIRNRDVDKSAKTLADDYVLPQSPGKNITFEQMMQYLSLLTPAMWNHLLIYLYRLRPKIRRQLVNPNVPNYIDVFSEPFTLDILISRHGGGKYQLQAVDTDKRKGAAPSENRLFECLLGIDEAKHPPILDYRELELEARENASYVTWLRNQGVLDKDGHPMPPKTAEIPNVNGMGAKEVLEILKYANSMNQEQQNMLKSRIGAEGEESLGKSIGTLLLEKMKQDDPSKQIGQWTALVSSMKDIIGTSKSDSGLTQIYDKLITLQASQSAASVQAAAEQRRIDLEYMKLILDTKQPPVEDSFAKFQQVFAFAKDLISEANRQGGKRTGWDTAIDAARDVGLPLIQTLGGVITNAMALKHGQPLPGPNGQPTQPISFDPYKQPQQAAAYAASIRNQQPQPQPAPQPPPPPPQAAPAPDNQLAQLFTQYGQLVISALNQGASGDQFAENIVALLGMQTHSMICANGEDPLTVTMLSIPEIAVFGEQRIRRFVYEFVHFEELADQDEEAIEPDDVEPPQVFRPSKDRKR